MKILTKYVVREHAGPLVFALTALTSLLMLQYVARQLGNLVGKGLPWKVIGEFFVLSLPFTVAMTMPMAVLVSTLYAFGRMAAEHEITAFKASGVRVTALMAPVLVAAAFLALGMVAFNDQLLPRANHRLRILQQDMSRTKPTLALEEQVLNTVTQGFFLRVARLDRKSNRMTDVVLYDLTQGTQGWKTIYADSGDLAFTPDKKDLQLVLYDGYSQEFPRGDSRKLQRSFFHSQVVRVKDIGSEFEQTSSDGWKGDREKSVCEMQADYVVAAREYTRQRNSIIDFLRKTAKPGQKTIRAPKDVAQTQGLARIYCNALALVFRARSAPPPTAGTQVPLVLGDPEPATPQVPIPGVVPPIIEPSRPAQVPITLSNGVPLVQSDSARLAAQVATPPAGQSSPPVQQVTATGQPVVQTAGAPVIPPATNPQTVPPQPVVAVPITPPAGGLPVKPTVSASTTGTPPVTAAAKPDSAAQQLAAQQLAAQQLAAQQLAAQQLAAQQLAAQLAAQQTAAAPKRTPAQQAALDKAIAEKAAADKAAADQAAAAQQAGVTPIPAGQVQINPAVVQPPVAGAAAGAPQTETSQVPATAAADSVAAIAASAAQQAIADAAEAVSGQLQAAKLQLADTKSTMDSLSVEVHKKFALSVACLVFVLFGPPIALRFPRGGVGATLGVSLAVFGLYYVCLMAGETLADDGKLPAWIAMWAANVIFTVVGILLLLRIERTDDATRGGGFGAMLADRKARRALRSARARMPQPSAAT